MSWHAVGLAAAAVMATLGGCAPDETVSGYIDPDTTWQLIEYGGVAYDLPATISFPHEGEVTGAGPCNRFNAVQNAPYPWVEIRQLASTRRACPDLAAEQVYFEALERMTLVEATGGVLILSDEDHLLMVFSPAH
ncbi:MAG: META domain-containing protein [Rhodobacteraceae bacterium]|nr:META domain-containing protein [Paracoccaceae bacterium]